MPQKEYDPSADYYKALGVTPSASLEEIKTAYVQLALAIHPDTAGPDIVNAKEEFHAVSTAYKVLSKPELKKQYDAARLQILGKEAAVKSGFTLTNARNLDVNRGVASSMASSVSSHEMKHEGMLRNINTGSDWTELQDKYRNEKWHKLSVETKKSRRTIPITSHVELFGRAAFLGGVAVTFGVIMYYRLSRHDKKFVVV